MWGGTKGEKEEGKEGEWEDTLGGLEPAKSKYVFQCDHGLVTQTPPPFNP